MPSPTYHVVCRDCTFEEIAESRHGKAYYQKAHERNTGHKVDGDRIE